jgi:aminoglycoside phosphotransferase (APT) family kinase protein
MKISNNQMHKNELKMNLVDVRKMLQEQCPNFSNLPLVEIRSIGSSHSLIRLGDEFVLRLPKLMGTEDNIEKEFHWVPYLAHEILNSKKMKTPVSFSVPIFKGGPCELFQASWLISKWNMGINPEYEKTNEYELLAFELANFLNAFHQIKVLPDAPHSRRGQPIINVDETMRKSIGQICHEFDSNSLTKLWDESLKIPNWKLNPVWVHGDLLPTNILTLNNHLNAVIDFSDVGIGDPACDLIIAWGLFNEESRDIFKKALKGIDEETWLRGCARALSIAVIMLPYYKNSNPHLAQLSRRIINQII